MKLLKALLLAALLAPSIALAQRTAQVDFLLNGVRDNSGNPIAAGTVNTYVAGTTTNKTCWTAYDKSVVAANPVVLDAYGRAQIYCEGVYKFLIKDSSGTTVQTLDNLFVGLSDSTKWWAGAAGGSANALTLTPSPAFPALVDGTEVSFIATATNTTTTPTAAVSGLTAKTITKLDDSALVAGDIISGSIYAIKYYASSDKWRLLNPSIKTHYYAGATTGSANAYVITLSPALPALVNGVQITFEASFTNTGAATLNVNSLGAIDLNTSADTAFAASQIVSGQTYTAVYETSTNAWLVLDPTYVSGTYTPTLTSVANIAASTAHACQYLRIGSVVNVGCRVDVDPTAAGPTLTQLGLTIPIASNFAANSDLVGACGPIDSSTENAFGIIGDSTNDRAQLQGYTTELANHSMFCNFTYVVK